MLPCAEGLSDRQAAEAVRRRMHGKYTVSLEVIDPGFDHTVLRYTHRTFKKAKQPTLALEGWPFVVQRPQHCLVDWHLVGHCVRSCVACRHTPALF